MINIISIMWVIDKSQKMGFYSIVSKLVIKLSITQLAINSAPPNESFLLPPKKKQ